MQEVIAHRDRTDIVCTLDHNQLLQQHQENGAKIRAVHYDDFHHL